ncbi:MAG TPA: SO2930 family diheme c-type cytochrome [Terriglobia bacterium]
MATRKNGRGDEPTGRPAPRRHNLALTGFLLLVAAGVMLLLHRRTRVGVQAHLAAPYPRTLSEWRLFVVKQGTLEPNQRVVAYDVNTPLFSDYADKYRFVWMPPGTSATYRAEGVFDFPLGTIFSKTFAFPAPGHRGRDRLIETRLLVHAKSGWVGLPYVWNSQESEAALDIAADAVPVRFTDAYGHEHSTNYLIPNANQCKECHARDKVMSPLGPTAPNLNRTDSYPSGAANQLGHWSEVGYLKGAPEPASAPRAAVWNDPSTGTLEARARTYLDINCGPCHRSGGAAATSALYLDLANHDPETLGVCKMPVAAGRAAGNLFFDIVPGKPEESIIVHRMESIEPKVMMPEIARTLSHQEGIALIREWVRSLSGACVAATPPEPSAGQAALGSTLIPPPEARGAGVL